VRDHRECHKPSWVRHRVKSVRFWRYLIIIRLSCKTDVGDFPGFNCCRKRKNNRTGRYMNFNIFFFFFFLLVSLCFLSLLALSQLSRAREGWVKARFSYLYVHDACARKLSVLNAKCQENIAIPIWSRSCEGVVSLFGWTFCV